MPLGSQLMKIFHLYLSWDWRTTRNWNWTKNASTRSNPLQRWISQSHHDDPALEMSPHLYPYVSIEEANPQALLPWPFPYQRNPPRMLKINETDRNTILLVTHQSYRNISSFYNVIKIAANNTHVISKASTCKSHHWRWHKAWGLHQQIWPSFDEYEEHNKYLSSWHLERPATALAT